MSAIAEEVDPGVAADRLGQRLAGMEARGAVVEAAMLRSVRDVLAGRHVEAARRVHAALVAAPDGSSAGWTLPIEPVLQVASHADAWVAALTVLRARAA